MNISIVFVFVAFALAHFVAPMSLSWLDLKKVHEIMPLGDKQSVLDCALANRGGNPDCWLMDKDKKHIEGFRDRMAKQYYDMLFGALVHIDGCLHLEANMIALPDECSYLDDVDLVEHCFLHHQLRLYEPCEGIINPRMTPPKDARTLFHYTAWHNISTEYCAQKPKKGLKGIVAHCIRCNAWLNEPDNNCHAIVKPNPRVVYSDRVNRMQMLYQQMEFVDMKRDCEHYHQDDIKNGTGECGAHAPFFKHAVDDMAINHPDPSHRSNQD